MKEVYVFLFRTGTEWDGQSIVYTESKVLFDTIKSMSYRRDNLFYNEFPEELKKEVDAFLEDNKSEGWEIHTDDIAISDAIEWFSNWGSEDQFPVIVLDQTELTASWNW